VCVGAGASVGRGVSVGGHTSVIVGGPAARECGQDEYDSDDHCARHCCSRVSVEWGALCCTWLPACPCPWPHIPGWPGSGLSLRSGYQGRLRSSIRERTPCVALSWISLHESNSIPAYCPVVQVHLSGTPVHLPKELRDLGITPVQRDEHLTWNCGSVLTSLPRSFPRFCLAY